MSSTSAIMILFILISLIITLFFISLIGEMLASISPRRYKFEMQKPRDQRAYPDDKLLERRDHYVWSRKWAVIVGLVGCVILPITIYFINVDTNPEKFGPTDNMIETVRTEIARITDEEIIGEDVFYEYAGPTITKPNMLFGVSKVDIDSVVYNDNLSIKLSDSDSCYVETIVTTPVMTLGHMTLKTAEPTYDVTMYLSQEVYDYIITPHVIYDNNTLSSYDA